MSADVCACGSRFHASCSASPAPVDDRSPTERAAAALALEAALTGERAASARALNAEAWAVAAMERCASSLQSRHRGDLARVGSVWRCVRTGGVYMLYRRREHHISLERTDGRASCHRPLRGFLDDWTLLACGVLRCPACMEFNS